MAHRHKYEVTRKVPNAEHPFVKTCSVCGKTIRYHRGRWVVTDKGSENRA